ncbi:tRNA (cytosine(34)-C(5))-methyltransferase-like [Acanthaster planci]|uniref:tRNA (cytosine(34)-C(5))-methyltransferase n=1 Tax=Acanthaster planci TaxID=133434 RepID=A0A8B7ZVF5_ACAPL|nr:tRNA (cytosine(34)-C(5))-methyltransferase-like [Acanthaster planci]
MARHQRRKFKQKGQGKGWGKNKNQSGEEKDGYHRYSYGPIEKKNEAFENYYKKQGVIPGEDWDKFMTTLRDELPVTFRITGYRSHAQHMLSYLKGHYISALVDKTVDGEVLERPKPMPWYPDELAWQFGVTRKSIRKMPEYKKLHDFLITETESGNISRQEAVSMIPPLLLDVKPHHKVLDMCAAPGSKTAQLIELVHAEQVYGWPEGFVVANDSDNKRCYIMVHQAKRLNSPCCMIVNHDATVFPTIRVQQGEGRKLTPLKYDRILCDVPCSGDGTLRKNFMIWKKWTPNSGLNLHILQHRVLLRGAELLEVGGRIVYSTCSFNPIENEAVVASVLQKAQGALELVDVSDELPGLQRSPGLTSWKIISETGEVFANPDEIPEDKRQKYKATVWPPTEVEAERLRLTRCIRVVPHHQNTGGFFVAVLRKVAPLPWMKQNATAKRNAQANIAAEANLDSSTASEGEPSRGNKAEPVEEGTIKAETVDEEPLDEEPTNTDLPEELAEPAEDETLAEEESVENDPSSGTRVGPPPAKKKKLFQGYKEDPFVFFKKDEQIWPQIKDFYAIDDKFPITQLLTRCHGGKKRNLYLVNEGIKSILENNEGNIKIINSGVKVWSRSDAKDVPCDFRLAQEGIYSIFPYLSPVRKITNITKDDIRTLLTQENPFCSRLDQQAREAATNAGQGSLIFVYDPKERDPESNDMSFVLVGWRGKTSVRSYIPKGERQHILRMCDIDIPPEGATVPSDGTEGGVLPDKNGDKPWPCLGESEPAIVGSSDSEDETEGGEDQTKQAATVGEMENDPAEYGGELSDTPSITPGEKT